MSQLAHRHTKVGQGGGKVGAETNSISSVWTTRLWKYTYEVGPGTSVVLPTQRRPTSRFSRTQTRSCYRSALGCFVMEPRGEQGWALIKGVDLLPHYGEGVAALAVRRLSVACTSRRCIVEIVGLRLSLVKFSGLGSLRVQKDRGVCWGRDGGAGGGCL